jgi:hypothetical protein
MKMCFFMLILLAIFYSVLPAESNTIYMHHLAPSLIVGDSTFTFPAEPHEKYGIKISGLTRKAHRFICIQSYPLSVEVTDEHGLSSIYNGSYSFLKSMNGSVLAIGEVTSANGTHFHFSDTYSIQSSDKSFLMSRKVTVQSVSAIDKGFSTFIYLPADKTYGMNDFDFLAPGIWYEQNSHAPSGALAGSMKDKDYLFREDRMSLPLIMMRNRNSGATVELLHIHGYPATFPGETGRGRIINSAMQFGSVGVLNHRAPGVAFWFPGTEGQRTYVPGQDDQGAQWAYREHPVAEGFRQEYQLLLKINYTPDYPSAVQQAWLVGWNQYHPSIYHADLKKAYLCSMQLLANICHSYDGVEDIPFELTVPGGAIPDRGALSGEMGFAGQQIPACVMVLRYGLETGNAKLLENASQIINFWAANARTPSGVMRTWYDITPEGKRIWRSYPMFLRVASDGLEGVLDAWSIMKKYGYNRPLWLQFARSYGDWLVKNQNPDGSFYRSYQFDGSPLDITTDTTDHPIKFLVELSIVTGNKKYLDAARKSGEYCLSSVTKKYAYVGGTPDNPNVMDKEGGVIALESFLALYDATEDVRYLKAASQAAWYTETWVYCWNIPMPSGDPECDFPLNRSTIGMSLIASGHSGADNFMAREPFVYFRLYLLTGEKQFRDFARMLLYNTKQLMDIDHSLHYAMPGLQLEAMSLSIPRGHSVKMWLPWLSVSALEPLIRFQDTFGAMDLSTIEKTPLKKLKKMSLQFGRTQGLQAIL